MKWQLYWSSWGLQWNRIPTGIVGVDSVFLIVGPFQMTWHARALT